MSRPRWPSAAPETMIASSPSVAGSHPSRRPRALGRKVKLLLQDECPDQFVVLQDAPLDLRPQGSADPGESQPPLGPNVELYLDDVDPTWQAIDQPVELVVIGHFDDRRAAYCPKDERQACRDRFVVDRVDRVDGLEQPLSAMNLSEPLEPSRIPDLDRLRAPLDDALILSVLMGEVHDGLPYREPVVLERSLGLDEMAAVWFFRVLVDDVQLTFVRVDGDDALYRVDGDTLVKVDGVPTTGTLATTPPLATPAPPAPVETPSTGRVHMVGLGSPSTGSVTVGVEDQDSLVRDVRAATDEEMRQFGGGTSLEGIRLREFAGQDTFYVSWVGYPCDASARIVLAAAGESGMTLDVYGQHVPCDERTIERAVVLRTLDPMALTAITTTDHLVAREFPSTALGMPVVDVERAQDVQHLAGVSRELAVGGWLSLGPPLMCAAPSGEPTSRLQPGCGDELNWLLERPEILTFQDGPTVALQEPSGPGIHVRFEAPQVDWPPVDDPGTVTPTPIVAIGHFDDPAAATCPPEEAAWCHDLFIIDSITWAYGHDLGFTGRLDDPKVKSTPDEIAQAIGAIDPAARVVAAWPTPGRGLAESELDLVRVPKAIGTASRVWIVKAIEAGQDSTVSGGR